MTYYIGDKVIFTKVSGQNDSTSIKGTITQLHRATDSQLILELEKQLEKAKKGFIVYIVKYDKPYNYYGDFEFRIEEFKNYPDEFESSTTEQYLRKI